LRIPSERKQAYPGKNLHVFNNQKLAKRGVCSDFFISITLKLLRIISAVVKCNSNLFTKKLELFTIC